MQHWLVFTCDKGRNIKLGTQNKNLIFYFNIVRTKDIDIFIKWVDKLCKVRNIDASMFLSVDPIAYKIIKFDFGV
jgi:hypothetical protein